MAIFASTWIRPIPIRRATAAPGPRLLLYGSKMTTPLATTFVCHRAIGAMTLTGADRNLDPRNPDGR